MTDKLTIAIAVKGKSDYLDNCLKSIKVNTKIDHEVFVVNTDGKDLSLAQAWNKGLDSGDGDYCCVLNDDTLLSEDALDNLLMGLKEHEDWGIVAPSLSHCVNEQKAPFLDVINNERVMDNEIEIEVYNIAYVIHQKYAGQFKDMNYTINGCCMIFSREDYEAVGEFDPDYYPCCYEECDFADKINVLLKKKSIWMKDVYVHHFGGKTREKRDDIDLIYLDNLFRRKMKARRRWHN